MKWNKHSDLINWNEQSGAQSSTRVCVVVLYP